MRYAFYPKSSGNLIHHAYHMAMFEERTGTRINNRDIIFEFGGGYGSLCRLIHQLGFKGTYIIYDLPEFSALQRYYLESLGVSVHTFGRNQKVDSGVMLLSDFDELSFLFANHLGPNSMFIATWSFSETPVSFRLSFQPLFSSFTTYLIAYQHRFGEIDNTAFFSNWKASFGSRITWHEWEMRHIPGNSYLVGCASD